MGEANLVILGITQMYFHEKFERPSIYRAIPPANDLLKIAIDPLLLLFSQPTCSSPDRRVARFFSSTLDVGPPTLLAPKAMRRDLRDLGDLLAFNVNRRFLLRDHTGFCG